MLVSLSLVGLLSSALVSASPAPQKRSAAVIPIARRSLHTDSSGKKLFDLEAAKRERSRIQSKYRRRGTSALTPHVKKSIEKLQPFDIQSLRKRQTGTGSVSLTDSGPTDKAWEGQISIGTPLQATTADFDTGSSDLVVPTADCQGCVGPLFNTAQSSTYVATSTPFNVSYADNEGAQGVVASDIVTVAGLTVQNQGFGSCSQETSHFGGPFASLLGLGFAANAESQTQPFFINLASQGSLASNVFSFYLARHGADGSELCLGCVDSSKYTGTVSFFPLDFSATNGVPTYWSLMGDGLAYNGQLSYGSALPLIIDSGTTNIYVPTAAAEALYSQIPGAEQISDGFYHVPCSAIETLPPIAFVFGGQPFAINPLDFNLGPSSSDDPMCATAVIGQSDPLAVLGDAFMKNWVTVFDLGGSQMGFAQAV